MCIGSTILRGVFYERVWRQDHYQEDYGIDQMGDIYRKPWHRFGSYGIGLILGCILLTQKDKQHKACMIKI